MYGHPKTILAPEEARAALARYDRLAIVFTAGVSGPRATHLPLVYEPPTDDGLGRLIGHMARGNDHWKDAEAGPLDVLIVMTGADTYISPAWYPSKARDARAVPTWNYETIHAHGKLSLFTDLELLRANVAALSDRHEAGRPEPWALGDAPDEYVNRLLGFIVGVEIALERVNAKRKLSQERPDDRASVIAALEQSPDPRDREVAAAMREI